jgi:hypothetical protein
MSAEIIDTTLAAARSHPGRRFAWRYVAWTVVTCSIAAVNVAAGLPAGAVIFGALGGLFAWSAWVLFRGVREVAFLNRALDACRRGDDVEANALIEAVAARSCSRTAARGIANHRALLALDAGDPKSAEQHASAAIAKRPGVLVPDIERAQLAWSHALRALSRAALRDDAGALADAERACDERCTTPGALGCGELARALVAAHGDQKSDVYEILGRARRYLDEVGGRERSLARSLARFAVDRPRSVYRHAAKPDEPELGDILLQPARAKASVTAFEAASAVPLPKAAKASRPRLARRTLLLWFALILLFVAIWTMLSPSSASPAPEVAAQTTTLWTVGSFSAVLVSVTAAIAFAMLKGKRRREAIRRAVIGARRHEPSSLELLETELKRGSPDAALALAMYEESEGEFAGALAHCEQGLAHASASAAVKTASWEIAAPGLAAERAFCLAALGRASEASAVIGSLPNATNYAYATSAHFRVRLANALVRGDRAAALEVARSRGDRLAIPSRDVLLCDLVEATAGRGADDEEWSRLNAQLADEPVLAKWIDHFMPKNTMQRRVAEAEPLEEDDSLERAREEGVDA